MNREEKIRELLNKYSDNKFGSIQVNDFDDLTEEIIALDAWIKTEEKMPESNVEVQLLHKNYEHPFFGQYYDIGDRWWLRGEKGHIRTAEVTHWKPLPSPPKGE